MTLNALLWLAIAINLAASSVYLWQIRRLRHREAAALARRLQWANCVAMIAYLARPESGSPEPLRSACANLVPPDVTLHLVAPSTTRTH